MNYGEISKLMIMHFIIAAVITVMVVFVLSTVNIGNLAYLGVFFGLFVFVNYGVNRLEDENLIETKSQKIALAVVSIIIFYLFFAYLMPFIFSMKIFGVIKIGAGLALNSQMIFAIFSVIVLLLQLR